MNIISLTDLRERKRALIKTNFLTTNLRGKGGIKQILAQGTKGLLERRTIKNDDFVQVHCTRININNIVRTFFSENSKFKENLKPPPQSLKCF